MKVLESRFGILRSKIPGFSNLKDIFKAFISQKFQTEHSKSYFNPK